MPFLMVELPVVELLGFVSDRQDEIGAEDPTDLQNSTLINPDAGDPISVNELVNALPASKSTVETMKAQALANGLTSGQRFTTTFSQKLPPDTILELPNGHRYPIKVLNILLSMRLHLSEASLSADAYKDADVLHGSTTTAFGTASFRALYRKGQKTKYNIDLTQLMVDVEIDES